MRGNTQQQKPPGLIRVHKVRRNLILALIGSIVVVNLPIILTQQEIRAFYNDITILVTASAALTIVGVTVYRQKFDGIYGRTYASLALGLGLWFTAELIWTYFEIGLQIETPFPSLADVFWLAGYGFFAYHLYRIYKFVGKNTVKPTAVFIVSITTAITLGYLVSLIFSASEISRNQDLSADTIILTFVSISYPVLDGILLAPAILILWSIRNGKLGATHWMLISLSMIFVAIADSGFGYSAVLDINSVQKEIWIWNILYNASYLSIAFALLWYNRFFIFNEKKEQKKWQERNR